MHLIEIRMCVQNLNEVFIHLETSIFKQFKTKIFIQFIHFIQYKPHLYSLNCYCTTKTTAFHSFISSICILVVVSFLVEYKFAYEIETHKRFKRMMCIKRSRTHICIYDKRMMDRARQQQKGKRCWSLFFSYSCCCSLKSNIIRLMRILRDLSAKMLQLEVYFYFLSEVFFFIRSRSFFQMRRKHTRMHF